jgi:hypothetical protein
MPTIPSGTKFAGVNPDVNTDERRSSLSNSYQEFYTIDDIIAEASAADTNIYNSDGIIDANRTVDLDGNTLRFSNGTVEFDQGSANSAEIKLYEDSDFGGNYVSIRAPQTLTTDRNFFLPGNQPTDGYFLKTDGGFGSTQWVALSTEIQVAASDETTALTTGTAKVTFRMPYAMTVTAVRASLSTAQASGSIFTVDINDGGTTILSTKLTIDNTEKTSTTAATPAVISDTALADDAEITVDIDQIGDGTAAGLKVTIIGTRA